MDTKKRKYNHPFYLELLKKLVLLEYKGHLGEGLSGEDYKILSSKLNFKDDLMDCGIGSTTLEKIYKENNPRYGLRIGSRNAMAIYAKFEDYNDFYKYYSISYFEDWIDEVPDIPFDKQEIEIQEKINKLTNRIIEEKINKQRASRNLINYDNDLFSSLSKVFRIESEINGFLKAKSILNTYNKAIEKQLVEKQFRQNGLIDDVLEQIDKHPEKIVDYKFLEQIIKSITFSYYSNRNENIRLAKKILPIANVVRKKIATEDKPIFSKLKAVHYRLVFSLDLVESQEYLTLTKNLEKSLSEMDSRGDLQDKELHNFFQDLFGYGSVVNSEYIDRFIDFCDFFEGSNYSKSYIKINARQCKACNLIRNNQLDDVERWLEEMDLLLKKHDQINLENYFGQMAFCNLIKGRFYFEKGSLFYEKARKAIDISIQYFFRTYGGYQKVIERGFAFYILYKIELYYDNKIEAIKNRDMALTNIKDSEKKRYCLFDTQKVVNELNSSFEY